MTCPACGASTRVLESRPGAGGSEVRRRRACPECGGRFTTFERRAREPLFVRKRDGSLQPFDRAKLTGGLLRAAHKRPVDPRAIERLVTQIEAEVERAGGVLDSERIGDACLAGLLELDRIAYLQFAAVYKNFSEPDELEAELRSLGVEPQRKTRVSAARVPSDAGG